ncbi:MAG: STAS domain-containing protein [Bacteroidota bacterium]|nr:STAS domain-containing protein [Bacteroidota bacterium]MDP4190580.1 STAS domain-containing protein [Bacteroidota bacterium]MDP4194239.1 STAS domain-containing protein [Bacteroidota bacterium]
MHFTREMSDGIWIERVNLERATLKEADKFKNILQHDIEQGCKSMIVDLSKCEFIDSTFLGAIVACLKKITTAGGDMKLIGFKPAVHDMFNLTRMFRVFETFPSVDQAVASFKDS